MPFDEVKSSRTGSSPRAVEIASAAVIAAVVVFALGYFSKDRRPAIDSRIPIVFEPSKHDFDTLQQNETRIADFRLVNRSQDALKLLSVRTSCACSVPPEGLQGKILQPGGFVHVPIRFETGDRSVQTNNKRHLSLVFQCRATVVPPFEVTPQSSSLPTTQKNDDCDSESPNSPLSEASPP